MPKDSDHSESAGDKDPAEAEKNRVQGSSPSRHRGSSPHASPPRFVSVDELMETAKGVTNMALAHEITMNQDFQLRPAELPEGSLERKVKEIMHKAFWDHLESQLAEEPPSYQHAIKLLAEIKEILLSFLPQGQGRMRSRIEEVLDLPLIQQQAEKGALDIAPLSQFVVWAMGSLCAPCREEDVGRLKEITEIVPLLKSIFSVLDLMKVDMANFALMSIRPHLMQQSVEYERNKFQEFLEKQPNALDFTERWLEDTLKCLREAGEDDCSAAAGSPGSSPLTPVSVHNRAYLRLLRWDHSSDPFPETVLMDQARFQDMQRSVDRLVLLSSVLLIAYTTAGDAVSGLPGLMETLKTIVGVMLTDMHAPSFKLEEALATIAEKLHAELSERVERHGFPPLSADQASALRGQVSAVAEPDNKIRRLMDSRVEGYLLAALEFSQHRTPPPLPGGLSPLGQELRELAVRFGRIVTFNKLVYSLFYEKILQKILTSAGSPGAET